MPTVMVMHWAEATKDQYDAARKQVNWEGNVPAGAKYHVCWFADDGLHVLDVWNSAEEFQRFMEQRLQPAIQRIGIKGQPKVELRPTHAIFAPNPGP
jgi:hypothetical protein